MTRKISKQKGTDADEPFLLYRFDDYKAALKARVKSLQQKKPGLTLAKIASRTQIQATYFSRVLNSEAAHLSEDQLYNMGRLLDFLPEEIDFILLLRSYRVTADPHRRQALFQKLDQIRKAKLASAETKEFRIESFQNEVAYLFSPLAIVVHVALFIKSYQKSPRLLCPLLGISDSALKTLLQILNASDYIVLSDRDPFEVLEVKTKYPHFGREHPLMRAHQTTLKALMQSRLNQTIEEQKESFLVTFTMDDAGFSRVKDEYRSFVAKVQAITFDCKHTNLYQLNFDFLKWL